MRLSPSRRGFLLSAAAIGGSAVAGLALLRMPSVFASGTIEGKPGKVAIHRFDDAGKSLGIATVDKVVKEPEEWQALLSGAAFYVARQEGTESAFTGPHLDNHEAGLYRCICCDNALFASDAKYESGTGWPSFWQPIAAENVVELSDRSFGMVRTAISCALCDGHLGHVFNDGPKPTGLRYCMNGIVLRFAPHSSA